MKRITTSHISLQDLSKSTSEKGEKSSSNFFYPKKIEWQGISRPYLEPIATKIVIVP